MKNRILFFCFFFLFFFVSAAAAAPITNTYGRDIEVTAPKPGGVYNVSSISVSGSGTIKNFYFGNVLMWSSTTMPASKSISAQPYGSISFILAPGATINSVSIGYSGDVGTTDAFTIVTDVYPPPVPANVVGSAGHLVANLSWNAVSASDLKEYRVYRNGTLLATVPAPTRTYQATGLTAGTTYSFQITSVDTSGNESAKSNTVNVTPYDNVPPNDITNLIATNITGNSFRISWRGSSSSDIASSRIYLDGQLITSQSHGVNSNRTYDFTGLQSETTYIVKVTSVDRSGNESVGVSITVTTLDDIPPDNPSDFVLLSNTYQSAQLSWINPTSEDLKTIRIYRGTSLLYSSTTENNHIGETRVATINGLAANTEYTLKITASDIGGNESSGVTLTFRTSPLPDTTPPDAPTGLTATPTNGNVVLSWNASTAPDLAGYNVYQDGVKVNSSLITSMTFYRSVPNNATYAWTVTAVDWDGNESDESAPVITHFDTISPLSPVGLALEPNGPYSVLAVWQHNTEPDLAGYSVYMNNIKLTTTLISENYYSVGNLVESETYSFQVSATDTSGNESPRSSPVLYTLTKAPDRPTSLRANVANQKVLLSWSAAPGAESYYVYRDGVKVGETNDLQYTDTGVTNGVTYKYEVVAVKVDKMSPRSTVYARPLQGVIDFSSQRLPFNVPDAVKTAMNFIALHQGWILLALGIIFSPIIWSVVYSLLVDSRKKTKTG